VERNEDRIEQNGTERIATERGRGHKSINRSRAAKNGMGWNGAGGYISISIPIPFDYE